MIEKINQVISDPQKVIILRSGGTARKNVDREIEIIDKHPDSKMRARS